MVSATLSRGSTSIDIPLVEEQGEVLLTRSLGKPELEVRKSGGTPFPRTVDQWSGNINYQLVGRLFDYQTAHDLADLIGSADPNNPLELEAPVPEVDGPITVAPSAGSDQALTLSFPAGKINNVSVQLELTKVNLINGNSQSVSTPTTTGTGPIEITANGTTTTLPDTDLSLERTVGRPNDVIRRGRNNAPRYYPKRKPISENFTLSFQEVSGITAIDSLTSSVFETQLGSDPIFLNFNGLFDLGEFAVMPTGSAPFRSLRQAGDKATFVPSLEVRRVYNPT